MDIKNFFFNSLSELIYNIFSLIISLLSVVIVLLESLSIVPTYLEGSFVFMDKAFSFVFLSEFIIRITFSEKKLNYLKWGWIDLLSAIPIYQFKVLRILRIIIFIRMLKSFFQLKRLSGILNKKNSLENIINSGFFAFILLTLLCLTISTPIILFFEHQNYINTPNLENSDHLINTLGKVLWWSFVTITTVGYGDLYPTTAGGKVTAIILMIFGIGLFSSVTVYFSSSLINRFQKNESNKEIKKLTKEINELKKLIQKNK